MYPQRSAEYGLIARLIHKAIPQHWYGMGRAWIEGLRTDSLYLFGWELFGVPIRVSQLFALVTGVIAGVTLVWALWKYRTIPSRSFKNRITSSSSAWGTSSGRR